MKAVIKFICSFICYLLFIPCVLVFTIGATWYLLPAFQSTYLGELIFSTFGEQTIFITTVCAGLTTMFFWLMGKLFTVVRNSKSLNFYTHIVTWILAIVLAAESVYSFIASGVINSVGVQLNLVRKIGILSCAISLLLYALIAPKVRKLVDRRIQAYDTAKELNAEGRSSVVGMQLLKCLDFICPEIFLLIALCFAFDWSISLYFIFIICSFILPLIGNMICDKRVKKEAARRKVEERDTMVNEIANAVQQQIQNQ